MVVNHDFMSHIWYNFFKVNKGFTIVMNTFAVGMPLCTEFVVAFQSGNFLHLGYWHCIEGWSAQTPKSQMNCCMEGRGISMHCSI